MIGITALNVAVNTMFMVWKTYEKIALVIRKLVRMYRIRKRR